MHRSVFSAGSCGSSPKRTATQHPGRWSGINILSSLYNACSRHHSACRWAFRASWGNKHKTLQFLWPVTITLLTPWDPTGKSRPCHGHAYVYSRYIYGQCTSTSLPSCAAGGAGAGVTTHHDHDRYQCCNRQTSCVHLQLWPFVAHDSPRDAVISIAAMVFGKAWAHRW